jgi:hypothetical protein
MNSSLVGARSRAYLHSIAISTASNGSNVMSEVVGSAPMRNVDALQRTMGAAVGRGYTRFLVAFAQWRERQRDRVFGPHAPRKDWELRLEEERYLRAADAPDLERMERAFDRRDAGGVRDWDWR